MNNFYLLATVAAMFLTNHLQAQSISINVDNFQPVNVSMSIEKLHGIEVIKVIKDSGIKKVDEPTFVKMKDVYLKNGIIEVKVLSRLLKDAPDYARGFIGIAFRIDSNNTKYESMYVRPINARVDDQVRRNHTIQYYAYPDYKFDRLRTEFPEQYESYTDMEMNKWISLRIEVKDSTAKLFINKNSQPALVVNDLKLGSNQSGAIGLWVDIGTEGYFRDIKIKHD